MFRMNLNNLLSRKYMMESVTVFLTSSTRLAKKLKKKIDNPCSPTSRKSDLNKTMLKSTTKTSTTIKRSR